MKINGIPGEYGFKGLIKINGTQKWYLTNEYYFSLEDLKKSRIGDGEVMWPVEILENGGIYAPDESELKL